MPQSTERLTNIPLEWHQKLVETLLGLKGKVMLCGFENSTYATLEASWNRVDFDLICSAGRSRSKANTKAPNPYRKESVWVNYSLEKLEKRVCF